MINGQVKILHIEKFELVMNLISNFRYKFVLEIFFLQA